GPEGLGYGQLNERPIFDVVVEVLPGGREARCRGIELGLLGDATRGEGWWEFSVICARLVKDGGLWRIKELSLTPLLRADYAEGWGAGGTTRSEEHTSELQSREKLVCRLLLEK